MITCPSCAARQSDASKFCSDCGAALAPEYAATVTHGAVATDDVEFSSSDSSTHGRFLPGTKLAGRYRIVSLLGKGGMGEVYRADDLRLGQTVALKFLPRNLAREPQRLEGFQAEVRLTRQISHPNVCRVYDMDEVDGHQFLSMEFIDGEDLRILLRRIGRLPKDKGIQIAQQMCAGVAAAHEKGVLHRDLKPANIMIDGRGQVRITDFGLAKLAEDEQQGEIAGTPAYMAPEQLRQGQTTIQSDLYSLGLILHELFTGEPVNKSGSIPELLKRQEDSSPSVPSRVVDDMDPVVERVILRCLEKQPHERPASAHALAAALPGGDPLAAALAAGETPSPEMVAAAGGRGGIDPRLCGALLAAVIVGLLIVCWLSDKTNLVNRVGMDKHPRELVGDARRIIKDFGYAETAKDSAWEFDTNRDYLKQLRITDASSSSGNDLTTAQPPVVFFWYRHSPVYLEAKKFFQTNKKYNAGLVTIDDPPTSLPGMITTRLDTTGRLIEFRSVSPQRDDAESSPAGYGWLEMFEASSKELLGFSIGTFTKVEPKWTPPVVFDTRHAWEGAYPNGVPIRVEAASYRGKPVYVRVISEWAGPEPKNGARDIGEEVGGVVQMLVLLTSACLASYHYRLARFDRRGSLRLAFYVFWTCMLVWLLRCSHVPTFSGESALLMQGLAGSVCGAALVWLLYVALEPVIRRLWPQSLISWSRILTGQFRDSLVGQHILAGVCFGVSWNIVRQLGVLASGSFLQLTSYLPPLIGTQRSLDGMLAQQLNAIGSGLSALLLLLLLKSIFRRQWLAASAYVAISVCIPTGFDRPVLQMIFITIGQVLLVTVLIRFGLLTFVVAIFVALMLRWPITTDTSAWYFGTGLSALLVILAIAAYGFYASLGKKPVLGPS